MEEKELEELLEEGHEEHEKHLQLGVDLSNNSRQPIDDDEEKDALWADATTVEQFKVDIISLSEGDPDIAKALEKERAVGSQVG